MKPSERLVELAGYFDRQMPPTAGAVETLQRGCTILAAALNEYLDEEAERRADFESDVLARLASLEGNESR